jgi:hypothetical protein
MGKRSTAAVLSLLWCPNSNGHALPIATVEHMAHEWLLLAPTSVTGTLTSQTAATVGHVAHARLLLAPTLVTFTLISAEHCYCWTCGTCTVAASAHSSDGHSNISVTLLLLDTWYTYGCC